MEGLKSLILRFPANVLYKASYLWFFIVVFFAWPPIFSGILTIILVLSLLIARARRTLWIADIKREAAQTSSSLHIDRPSVPWSYWGLRLGLVLAVSAVLGYVLDGVAGLAGIQFALVIGGLAVLQLGHKLLGANVTYLITREGIGVVCGDLRLFLHFDEIAQMKTVHEVEDPPAYWAILTPVPTVRTGLLLRPKAQVGFTRFVDHVFISPGDMDEFLAHLPSHLLC